MLIFIVVLYFIFQIKNHLFLASDEETNDEKKIDGYSIFMEPIIPQKYHNYEIKKSKELFENKNWPDASECDKKSLLLDDSKEYVEIYLPPENKGYATRVFVNELIGIDPDKEHALPWYPPVCQPPDTYNEKFISQALLKATSTGNHLPEKNLASHLKYLVKNAELAEIGQRILTATKTKVGSPWVLAMLSSLHWRVVGKPRNALDCLKLALNTVPNRFKDVPLVSIAAIGHKVGLIDDSIKAVKEAIRVNPVEVINHAKNQLNNIFFFL